MAVKRGYLLSFLFIGLITAACGKSGSPCGFDELASVRVTVDGMWRVTETALSGDAACSETNTYDIDVSVSGNAVTITRQDLLNDSISDGGEFAGEISDNKMKWSEKFGHGSATKTVDCITVTVSDSGTSFSGTSTWRIMNGTVCTGTSTLSGSKL